MCRKEEPGVVRKEAEPVFEQRGAEPRVEQGGADRRDYLTPIRFVPGAVFTSTGTVEGGKLDGGTAETKIYKKDRFTTGLKNDNFMYGYTDVGEEENIYAGGHFYEEVEVHKEEKLVEGLEVEKEKEPVAGPSKRSESSASFGIYESKRKLDHSYVNLNPENMIDGLPAILDGPENLQTGNTGNTEKDITSGDIDGGVPGESGEPEGNLESGNEPETSLEWDSKIEWNQTIIPEAYTQSIVDETPRRSKRLAEKQVLKLKQ